MTIDLDDEQASEPLASLRRCDVSSARARQLRRRCHAVLQGEPRAKRLAGITIDLVSFRRVAVPALGALWCLAYLVEITRCTAAVVTYLGSQ